MEKIEIPEELANLDFETYDAILALVVPEKKGEIVSITNLVEEEVTIILAGGEPPSSTLLKKSFSDKIKSLDRRYKSDSAHSIPKEEVISFLTALLDIRNLVSHTYQIGFEELAQLEMKHPRVRSLLIECPNNLWAAVGAFKTNIAVIN